MDNAAGPDPDASFALPAIKVWFRSAELLADPGKCALVIEYALWDAHIADWRSRRPAKVHGRRKVSREWLAEGQVLFAELDAMKSMVRRSDFFA